VLSDPGNGLEQPPIEFRQVVTEPVIGRLHDPQLLRSPAASNTF